MYGQPAVAVAIDQRMNVNLELNSDWRIDGMTFQPESRHPHVEALKQRLWDGGPPLSIKITGDIPPASGLGSSAALSVAASAALRCARGRQLKDDDWAEGWTAARPNNVYDGPWDVKGDSVEYGLKAVDEDECAILSHAVEAFAQGGKASPMDSSTCAHGGCIVLSDKVEEGLNWLYSRNLNDVSWEVHSVDLENIEDVWLVIGSTGIHAPTSEQVAKVASLLDQTQQR